MHHFLKLWHKWSQHVIHERPQGIPLVLVWFLHDSTIVTARCKVTCRRKDGSWSTQMNCVYVYTVVHTGCVTCPFTCRTMFTTRDWPKILTHAANNFLLNPWLSYTTRILCTCVDNVLRTSVSRQLNPRILLLLKLNCKRWPCVYHLLNSLPPFPCLGEKEWQFVWKTHRNKYL